MILKRPKVATTNGTTPAPNSASAAMMRPTLLGSLLRRMTMMPPAKRTSEARSVTQRNAEQLKVLTEGKAEQEEPCHSRPSVTEDNEIFCDRNHGNIENDLGDAKFGTSVQHSCEVRCEDSSKYEAGLGNGNE